jgi:NAD(P)-dependent dehydrogenase (short-subunit alcohol dehydrogenase family)
MATTHLRPKIGKVALVTGAAQGLGLAFAERLSAEGAIVIAVDAKEAPGLRDRLIQAGAPEAHVAQVDVGEAGQIKACCEAILERHGRCDIIVNNAGIYPRAELSEISLELWRRTMAVNVESVFLFCQALVPSMMVHRYGRIVNISSDTLGIVISGFSHYMATKAAIIGFTRGLANEVGSHGITVNVIAPGRTQTPSTEKGLSDPQAAHAEAQKHAIKRIGQPEDLVGAMSFLTSDDAAFMTAQTLIVDGGLLRNL